MVKQHSTLSRLSDGTVYLIGGPAISQYEVYFNVYSLDVGRENETWQVVKDNQLLREKMENSRNVYRVLGDNLWVLCEKAEQFIYTELLVYSIRDLRLLDVRQLKIEIRFSQLPKIIEDSSSALYLFDLNSLYRLNSDKSLVKVNKGVFLSEPTDISYFRIGGGLLWVWSTSTRELIRRQSVKLEDL